MSNPFFKNTGPYKINELLKKIDNNDHDFLDENVNDVKDLYSSKKGDISFYNSKKYVQLAKTTKASYCITSSKLRFDLPISCKAIISENVLLNLAKITKMFYPDSIFDDFDKTAKDIIETKFKNTVDYGNNVLIGDNVSIGSNCSIGHNSIIEKNVYIGNNCSIGSNVIIKNTFIKNNVHILDGCIIGKKGFGFFPKKNNNYRYPQIGIVIIEDNVEIGSNSTIDRGSLSNTIVGKNTFLDNQIHIAHNVKIGENCILAAQVGLAGSTSSGDNVMIGGQAGISGHLNIGSNVQIGGGSGVVKNIPDNSKVMGYPAKDLKIFIRQNK